MLPLLLSLIAQDVLALDGAEPDLAGGAHGGLLVREIVRQAVLIAGRDGLGLATRDHALREPLGERPLSIRTRAVLGKQVAVRVARGTDVLWEQEIPFADYAGLVKACEALSRGAFVEVLKKAGFAGTPNARADRGRVPDAVEGALMTLTFSEQVRALRELRVEIRRDGEAPQRLLGLARGYAHLGKMCEYLLYPAHKAFKARALLYAERAVAAWPESPLSYGTRAYARALVGFHGPALDDLRKAGDAPPWVRWIEAFCRYDATTLAGFEAPYNKGFLRLLGFLLFEECRNDVLEVRKLREAIDANPECYYLYEAMMEMGGIGLMGEGHRGSTLIMGDRLRGRLEAMKAPLDDGPRIWDPLLRAADDAGEPSWPALGRIVQYQVFGQVWRKATVDERRNAGPARDVEAARPLWEDHPYRALIESFLLDRRRQPAEWKALVAKLTIVDPELQLNPIFRMNDGARQDVAWRAQDEIARDLETKILYLRDDQKGEHGSRGRALLAVSPHNPMGVRALIPYDWDTVKDRAEEWERHFDAHPQVLLELGRKYRELRRVDDAERLLKKAVERAPNKAACEELAELYKERGDWARWESTLEALLATEDHVGLINARVRTDMAKAFMARKDWAKARRYAEEAAKESNAAWAIDAARDACEGLGDLETALEWQQKVAKGYKNEAVNWYFFTQRTGFGDAAEAEAHALQGLTGRPGMPSEIELQQLGALHELAGRPAEARAAYEKALALKAHPFNALNAGLVAQQLGDVEARDKAFQAGLAYDPKDASIQVRERDLLKSIAAGGAPDLKAWEAMLAKQDGIGKTNLPWFMGRSLELAGRPDDAKAFYARSAAAAPPWRRNAVLSAAALRRLK